MIVDDSRHGGTPIARRSHHDYRFAVDGVGPGLVVPGLAPFSTRNLTTVSYWRALAASSAVRPSVLAAFTSTPSSAASLTASRVSASRSRRGGGTHSAPPPIPVAAITAVVTSFRC